MKIIENPVKNIWELNDIKIGDGFKIPGEKDSYYIKTSCNLAIRFLHSDISSQVPIPVKTRVIPCNFTIEV